MEPDEKLFKTFHRYNKLVRREMVKPLTCRSCGFILITGINDTNELVLNCLGCDSTTKPGLATISSVEAVVKEHFIDD